MLGRGGALGLALGRLQEFEIKNEDAEWVK